MQPKATTIVKRDRYRPEWYVATPENQYKQFRIDATRIARYMAKMPPEEQASKLAKLVAILERHGVAVPEGWACMLEQ